MDTRTFLLSALAPKAQNGEFLVPGMSLYGDSIMFGGVADNLKFSLRMRFGPQNTIVVHDRSVPGDTARNGWRRFPHELRSTSTVVLEYGTNDISQEHDPLPYLERMARYAIKEGRVVVFTGIVQRALLAKTVYLTNQRIRELARTLECGHAGWDKAEVHCPDGLHPDADGTRKLSDLLVPYF
jgi:lysophospholipase L1-like esterase